MYRLFRKKYAVPIGHGNSFFGHGKVIEKSWTVIVEKHGHPGFRNRIPGCNYPEYPEPGLNSVLVNSIAQIVEKDMSTR